MSSSTANSPERTQQQVQKIRVQPLTAASVFLASNPRIFHVTAAGPVRIPKLSTMTAPSSDTGSQVRSAIETAWRVSSVSEGTVTGVDV
jgi:hypothetical protein